MSGVATLLPLWNCFDGHFEVDSVAKPKPFVPAPDLVPTFKKFQLQLKLQLQLQLVGTC